MKDHIDGVAQYCIYSTKEDELEKPKINVGDKRPLLVVPDSRGRLRNWNFWRKQPYWRDVIVLCSNSTTKEYLEYLQKRYINYIITGDDHVDICSALKKLNSDYNIKTVRVDSGGTLNGVLLRAGIVNEISLLLHPKLVGGTTPQSFFRANDLTSSEGVINLKLIKIEKLKNDIVWLRYEVSQSSS